MNTEEAKKVLKEAGYFVGNLWSVQDVQTKFNVDDEKAREILDATFFNDYLIEETWSVIELQGEGMGFERVD